MKITRTATVQWAGGMQDGKGSITTQSHALDSYPYGFASRFEGQKGSNPEELIAAANASCFTMALSMMLGEAKLRADKIDTTCAVTLEQQVDGFSITSSHLTVKAVIPGADETTFAKIAGAAKAGCPISKLLKTEISLEAHLQA
jgi:lipoyl-dependent peroxiredoxin